MTRISTHSIIFLGIILLAFYVSESECKSLRESILNMVDKDPNGYTDYFRKVFIDATHVLDNLIAKSKMTLMDLPHEDWLRQSNEN